MNYRINISILFFVLLVNATAVYSQQKPNIIFILTDDQRWDALGAAQNKIIQTPNLDKLANEGILFQNAYVTTAICCVSRASLLTGQYKSRHKIDNFKTDLSLDQLANSYPIQLKNAGYKLGFVGKYGVGNKHPIEYFDYWSCSKKEQPDYIFTDGAGNTIHNTDSVGHDIEIFLNQFAGKEPFCLSVGFKAPHELDGKPPQFITQPRFDELYRDITIPQPETADPKYWNSFPDFFRTDSNIARVRWKPLFATPEKYQETVKNYYRLVTGVDDIIGKMVAQLKKLGIDKNTVIIFMGDNGFFLGEHGLEGKWYGYEESIRVPLIIYDPRLPANQNSNRNSLMVLNIDIAPTILSLAGVPIPKNMQGKSIYDFISKKIPSRNEFFYEHTFLKTPQIPNVEGVVTSDLKYMNYIEHNYEELYSVKNDPKEKVNLARNKKYAAQLNKLRSSYKKMKETVK